MSEAEQQKSSAPPAASPHDAALPAEPPSRWQRAKFIFQAIEVRLRFIAVFVGIGLLMVYWSTLENYWDRWTRPSAAATAEAGTEYYCPMHPSVVRPGLEPNGAVPSCPICGMPLSKRRKGQAPALPEGITARVQLSPERVQLAGVKTAAASYMPLVRELRTVGVVEYDESRLSEIVTRVSGYLEKLYIDKTFVTVERNQPLAEIYSPQLYSSAQELLLAKKHKATDLVASARQRLKLLGIGEAEIDDLVRGDNARARLLIRSPQSGHVIEKNIVEGAAVQSGTVLFKVADLSTVWIEANVYEKDIGLLHADQAVEATVESLPGRVFEGRIALVHPHVNPETRTNSIRIVLENPEHELRPGMFATVEIRSPVAETEPFQAQLASFERDSASSSDEELIAMQTVCPVTGKKLGSMGKPIKTTVGDETVFLCCAGCEEPLLKSPEKFLARLAGPPEGSVLSIPESAVIDTGKQKIVYVEREPGLFEGVEVKLGPRTGGYYPVLEGLTQGDKVAAAGAFLLDAETRLNPAAAAAYFGAGGSRQEAAASGSSGEINTSPEPKETSVKPSPEDLKNIARLPAEDRKLAMEQAVCPISGEPLGSMGVPVKVLLKGRPVFLCCSGCLEEARERADEVLKKLDERRRKVSGGTGKAAAPGGSSHQHHNHAH